MFGISGFELFIILLFGFLLFGPDKLPAIAKTVGKGIAKFRSAQQEMNDVIKNDLYDPDSDEPFKNPVEALDKLAARHEKKSAKSSKTGASAASSASSGATTSAVTAVGASGAGTPRAQGAGVAGAGSSGVKPRQESFTERKARYERERAARKKADEEQAAQGGKADETAKASDAENASQAASTDGGE